jgi:very-short-patch-repair endonuclease
MVELVVASEAIATGVLTRRDLRRGHVRVVRNVYAPRGVELTARDVAVAAWLSSGRRATLAGLSAAALLGSRWVPRDAAAEILGTHSRAPVGIVAHAGRVLPKELDVVGGIRCTNAARTAYDLGRRLPFMEGVIRVDALLNATGVPLHEVAEVADRYPGARHIRRLRRVLEVADAGAESPQETRVRCILIASHLPRPVTQIRVGRRRVDMGWPQWKVGVEYDGPQHWDAPQRRDDIDRAEFLAGEQWRIVRLAAEHLRYPQRIVDRAEAALLSAGWRPAAS